MSYKIKVIESERLKTIEVYIPTNTGVRNVIADIVINKKRKTADIQIPRDGDYQSYPVDFDLVVNMSEHCLVRFMLDEISK